MLYTATYGGAALHTKWEVAPNSEAIRLTTSAEPTTATPLAPLASTLPAEPHRYQLPGSSDYRSWATRLPSYRLDDQEASLEPTYLPSADVVKTSVQRSWQTIKLAFR